jgi:sirohydrochlorin cobaltochelatase
LDVVPPSIPVALEKWAGEGREKDIWVLPYFLFAARHVKKDIPEILKAFQKKHPGLKVRLAQPLGSDPQLLEILDRRLRPLSRK